MYRFYDFLSVWRKCTRFHITLTKNIDMRGARTIPSHSTIARNYILVICAKDLQPII